MRSWSAYRRGVLALALVTLLWRGWTMSRWTWDADDWVYMANTRTMGFWEYLVQDYNGHLMPGEFLISWVVTRLAPLNFWLPVVLVALASAGSVWVWGRALAEVAGERLVVLLPLGLLALTPLMIRPTIWWASALQVLPLQLALGLVVIAAARLARTGARADLLWLMAALLAGMAFWEKALLLVIPAVAVLLHLGQGGFVARVRQQARPIALVAGVGIAYLATYALLTRTEEGDREMGVTLGAERSVATLTEFFVRGFGDLFAPGLLGGPWGTTPLATDPYVQPPQPVVWASIALVVVLAAWAWSRVVRAWIPLVMTAVYVAVSWGLVLYSARFENLQLAAINDERYHVDTLAVAVLAVAMVLGSPRRRRATSDPQQAGPPPAVGRRTTALVGAALMVSLVASNVVAAVRIGTHPARPWVEHVTQDVERLEPVALVDDSAPGNVLPPVWWTDDARMSRMLSPLDAEVSFGGPAEQLWVVDDDGRLKPIVVGDAAHARPGNVEGCGYAVGPGERVLAPLTQGLYAWEWFVQVDAFSGDGGTLTVELGDSSATFEVVEGGVTRHQFAHTGLVPSTAVLSVSDDSSTVCVADLVVGGATPGQPSQG